MDFNDNICAFALSQGTIMDGRSSSTNILECLATMPGRGLTSAVSAFGYASSLLLLSDITHGECLFLHI